MANHTVCHEGIYWGGARVTGLHRTLYNLFAGRQKRDWFRGHIEGDAHFWGDVCRERIKYVRNFVFPGMDTLAACPFMPYHDPDRPFVNHWFASSEGGKVNTFTDTICEANQDQLEAAGSVCIMYTHFAKGFYQNGRLDDRFKFLMERLAKKNGWFAPASTVLDHLLQRNGGHTITPAERSALERRWLRYKARVGTT